MPHFPSFGPSPRGGTFRPRLEVLEDRFAPGSLLTWLDGWAEKRELLAAAQVAAATRTTSPVVEFTNPGVVRGESSLTRTDHGVTMHLSAANVPAGAYTAWWVLFENGATTPVVGWATGHVVGQGGNLTVATHLKEGEVVSGDPVFPSGPLQDAQRARIWMVIRNHGPVDPGRVYEQTHTFEPTRAFNFLITMHQAP